MPTVVSACGGAFLRIRGNPQPTRPRPSPALALGLGAGPAAALLVTAPSAGPVTFAVTRRDFGWQVPARLLLATFAGGVVAGLLVGAL